MALEIPGGVSRAHAPFNRPIKQTSPFSDGKHTHTHNTLVPIDRIFATCIFRNSTLVRELHQTINNTGVLYACDKWTCHLHSLLEIEFREYSWTIPFSKGNNVHVRMRSFYYCHTNRRKIP
jgi:hypothetical protein